MRKELALFALVATTSAASAQSVRIDRAEILQNGIMRQTSEVKTIQSKDLSTGRRSTAETEIVETTTTIPARVGVLFGSDVRLHGRQRGKQANLRVVWRYPQPGIKNPQTGIAKLVDEYVDKRETGTTTYFWSLGDAYTLVTGTWTLELWQDDRRLARQEFELVPDPCGKRDGEASLAACTNLIKHEADNASAYFDRAATREQMGDIARAIADYSKAAELAPKHADYARSLGVARYEAGEFPAAARDLRRAVELSDDIYAMLFRYLARGRANEDGGEELLANIGRLKTKEWPYAVAELYLGKRSATATLDAADKPEEKCEAHFYIGQWHLLKGQSDDGVNEMRIASDTCPRTFFEASVARAELGRAKRQ